MTLNVPVRVLILGIVVLVARHLDLLETPLRKYSIRCDQVAARVEVPESQPCRKRMDPVKLGARTSNEVVNDFDNPVIVRISDSSIAVARDFVVEFRDRSHERMRVQVAASRGMNEAKGVAMLEEAQLSIRIDGRVLPSRRNEPVIVLVLVMIARDLLLL